MAKWLQESYKLGKKKKQRSENVESTARNIYKESATMGGLKYMEILLP